MTYFYTGRGHSRLGPPHPLLHLSHRYLWRDEEMCVRRLDRNASHWEALCVATFITQSGFTLHKGNLGKRRVLLAADICNSHWPTSLTYIRWMAYLTWIATRGVIHPNHVDSPVWEKIGSPTFFRAHLGKIGKFHIMHNFRRIYKSSSDYIYHKLDRRVTNREL